MRSRSFPRWMRNSARVDFAQLLNSIRPVIRSEVLEPVDPAEVRRWARRIGLYVAMDRDGFFTMSRDASAARRTLRIDTKPGKHTVALGLALGYPRCCCLAAGRRGDAGLDGWATSIMLRRFIGPFQLIRPGRYSAGQAYISHVPCSPRCVPSLRMAQSLDGDDHFAPILLLSRSAGRRATARRQTPVRG